MLKLWRHKFCIKCSMTSAVNEYYIRSPFLDTFLMSESDKVWSQRFFCEILHFVWLYDDLDLCYNGQLLSLFSISLINEISKEKELINVYVKQVLNFIFKHMFEIINCVFQIVIMQGAQKKLSLTIFRKDWKIFSITILYSETSQIYPHQIIKKFK